MVPEVSTRVELDAIGALIREAVTEGDPSVSKLTLSALVDRIEISGDRQAYPYFRVPTSGRVKTPPQPGAAKTAVRMDKHPVVMTHPNTNQRLTVRGPMIRLQRRRRIAGSCREAVLLVLKSDGTGPIRSRRTSTPSWPGRDVVQAGRCQGRVQK